MADVVHAKNEGPYPFKPSNPPPETTNPHGKEPRWEQIGGVWWAFYHPVVGPGREYGTPRPENPLWHSIRKGTKAFCRHGLSEGNVCCGTPANIAGVPVEDDARNAVRGLKRILGEPNGAGMPDEGVKVYDHDLRQVVELIDKLDQATETEDLYVETGVLVLVNKNDYQVGTLRFENDKWNFTAHPNP